MEKVFGEELKARQFQNRSLATREIEERLKNKGRPRKGKPFTERVDF
jgi:hypothetical protein